MQRNEIDLSNEIHPVKLQEQQAFLLVSADCLWRLLMWTLAVFWVVQTCGAFYQPLCIT